MKLLEKKTEPDIEGLLAVIRRQSIPARVYHLELFLDEEIKDRVGERFGLAEGIEGDEPDLVETVFQRVSEFCVDYTRTLSDFSCIRLIWGSDDMGFRTSTMVSAPVLKEKVLLWHKRCAAISHEQGRPYLLHSCGNLEKIMPALIEDVKIDAKHFYEDVILPVTEAKQRYGQQIAILGGIDMDFLCRADEQAIRKQVRETLDVCMPGGGYCLETGNSVANYIPLDNYLIMLDEGRRFILS